MAAKILLCLLGCLVLASLVAAGHPEPDPDEEDDDIICEIYTIRHDNKGPPKKVSIDDDKGRPADITKVTVEQRLSREPCIEDKSYTVRDPVLAVFAGCQAKFKVCYRSSKGSDPTVPKGCKLVRILSRYNRKAEVLQKYQIKTMKRVRKFSKGETCNKDNYGFRDKTAFADKGCRADFEVCFKGIPPTDEDAVCKKIYLKSTRSKDDERVIKNDEGDTVTIISIEPVEDQVNDLCRPWKTFSYEDSTVTAKDGCVGRFKVCYESDDIEATVSPDCVSVRLLSHDNVDDRKKITRGDGKIKSMQLKRQYGGKTCVRDKNYGFDKDSVFARSGCRAQFTVCGTGLEYGTDNPDATCINVKLGVKNGSDRKGFTGRDGRPARIESIRLLRPDSNDDCILDKTFKKTSSEVKTSDGCRGLFRVCYS